MGGVQGRCPVRRKSFASVCFSGVFFSLPFIWGFLSLSFFLFFLLSSPLLVPVCRSLARRIAASFWQFFGDRTIRRAALVSQLAGWIFGVCRFTGARPRGFLLEIALKIKLQRVYAIIRWRVRHQLLVSSLRARAVEFFQLAARD